MKVKKDTVVMKFGGTSVGSIDKINKVAEKVIKCKSTGANVIVALSAMGSTTDDLIELAGKISKNPGKREMDMLLSTGEQVSIALLAIAIQEKGYESISLTGSQAGILTDKMYSNAKILSINNERIIKELRKGRIVIIAGFQGITLDGDISTLGRGGSDTTAVAIAATIGAKYCEIYTDVDGVFTTDPSIVSESRKIKTLSYDEMLEMASSGAKVLHLRAVEFAKKHEVVLHVRSSFNNSEGTWIMDYNKSEEKMERPIITGVTYDNNQVKVSVFGLIDKPGVASKLFGGLASENINVDLIVQNVSEKNLATISFTIEEGDMDKARKVLGYLKNKLEIENIKIDSEIAKVTIIGEGMKTHPGVAAKMFDLLGAKDINIEMISTSPIGISCVVRKSKIREAVKILHKGFGLEK
ncbi:MAG: aspartate kinase [Actinobacteria bacterium]|nr:aspartate kinase [Actinomycetota bacterium]